MKKIIILFFFAFFCQTVNVFAQDARPVTFNGVAATVNGRKILIGEVMKEISLNLFASNIPESKRQQELQRLYPVALELMIDRFLILDEFKNSGLVIPDGMLDAHIRSIVNSSFNGDRAVLLETIKQYHLTYDAWKKQTEDNYIVASMRYMNVDKKVVVTPKAIREYYSKNKKEFSQPHGTKIRVIQIPPSDGIAVVNTVMENLNAGVPFAEVARLYSKDSKARDGGDWGVVNPKEMFAAEIANKIDALKVGEYSDAITLDNNFYILFKEALVEEKTMSLTEAWSTIEEKLNSERGKECYEKWIKELRSKAFIQITKTTDVK